MRIRPATPDDRVFLFSLTHRLALVGRSPWRAAGDLVTFQERFIAESIDKPGAVTLVAEEAEDRLGFITVEPSEDAVTGAPVGYVSLLAVTAHAEGRGIGAQLVTAAENHGRSRSWQALSLEVFASNDRGRAFYSRQGFAEDMLTLRKPL